MEEFKSKNKIQRHPEMLVGSRLVLPTRILPSGRDPFRGADSPTAARPATGNVFFPPGNGPTVSAAGSPTQRVSAASLGPGGPPTNAPQGAGSEKPLQTAGDRETSRDRRRCREPGPCEAGGGRAQGRGDAARGPPGLRRGSRGAGGARGGGGGAEDAELDSGL